MKVIRSRRSQQHVVLDLVDHAGDFGVYHEGGGSHRRVLSRGGMGPVLCIHRTALAAVRRNRRECCCHELTMCFQFCSRALLFPDPPRARSGIGLTLSRVLSWLLGNICEHTLGHVPSFPFRGDCQYCRVEF